MTMTPIDGGMLPIGTRVRHLNGFYGDDQRKYPAGIEGRVVSHGKLGYHGIAFKYEGIEVGFLFTLDEVEVLPVTETTKERELVRVPWSEDTSESGRSPTRATGVVFDPVAEVIEAVDATHPLPLYPETCDVTGPVFTLKCAYQNLRQGIKVEDSISCIRETIMVLIDQRDAALAGARPSRAWRMRMEEAAEGLTDDPLAGVLGAKRNAGKRK